MLNEKIIEKLEEFGGKRWTKGNYDRMYFNDNSLGFEYDCYKSSGRIAFSKILEWETIEDVDMEAVNEFAGDEISNTKASSLAGGKHYIDLNTGEISSYGFFKARIQYLIKKAEKSFSTEEKSKSDKLVVKKSELIKIALYGLSYEYGNFRVSPDQPVLSENERYEKKIGKIFLSTDKKFATVEVTITKLSWTKTDGYVNLGKHGSQVFTLTINTKTKKVAWEMSKSIQKNRDGEIDEFSKFEGNMIKTLEKYSWKELKFNKKFSVSDAINLLTEAKTEEEIKNVYKKCSAQTLKVLGKATEHKMQVKILSRFRKKELIAILLQNCSWILNLDTSIKKETFSELLVQFYKMKEFKNLKNFDDKKIFILKLHQKEEISNFLQACTKKVLSRMCENFNIDFFAKMKKIFMVKELSQKLIA